MKKSTVIWVGGVLFFLLIIAATVIGILWIFKNKAQQASGRPPQPQPVMESNLIIDDADRQVAPGDHIGITGIVASTSKISKVELWINGTLVDTRVPPDGWDKETMKVIWDWQPSGAGQFSVITRGVDDKGVSNYSSQVSVEVDSSIETSLPEPGPLAVGFDSLPQIPAGEMEKMVGEEPTLSDIIDDPVTSLEVESPYGVINSASPKASLDVPSDNLMDTNMGIELMLSISDDCAHNLLIRTENPNINYYYVYVDGPADADEFRTQGYIERSKKYDDTTYVDNSPKVLGIYNYYVVGYTDEGEISSDILSVDENHQNCASQWNGTYFVDVKLRTKQKPENLYCYVQFNELDWDRLPVIEGAYLQPMTEQEKSNWLANMQTTTTMTSLSPGESVYDLSSYMPSFEKTGQTKFDATVECYNVHPIGLLLLGRAKGQIDLMKPNQVNHLATDDFTIDIYINTYSNMSAGSGNMGQIKLVPPKELDYSWDISACAMTNDPSCENLMKYTNHFFVLKWKWDPADCLSDRKPCIEKPDGFRIYGFYSSGKHMDYEIPYKDAVDGYFSRLVYSYHDDNLPDDDPNNRRVFAVTAFSGDLESQLSDFEFVLPPADDEVKRIEIDGDTTVFINGHGSEEWDTGLPHYRKLAPSELVVASSHVYDPSGDWYVHGKVKFDLSQLDNKIIRSAYLLLPYDGGWIYICDQGTINPFDLETNKCRAVPNTLGTLEGCAVSLLGSTEPYGGFVAHAPRGVFISTIFSDRIDVTSEVSSWVNGYSKNYGFFITTQDFYTSTADYGCFSYYSPVQLVVEYVE